MPLKSIKTVFLVQDSDDDRNISFDLSLFHDNSTNLHFFPIKRLQIDVSYMQAIFAIKK